MVEEVKNISGTLPSLSIVIPTLDEASRLPRTLEALSEAASRFAMEILVADGGSADGTAALAAAAGARVVAAPRGRGAQLAAGVAAARGRWVLLWHADTRPEPGWTTAAAAFCADPANARRAAHFRFALDSAAPRARLLERAVAWRCRVLGLPYGDQGLLIGADFLAELGGVAPLPLMEDVELVRRIGRRRLVALAPAAVTSAEKWKRQGWTRRSARNLLCLSLYLAGVPPQRIARLYGGR
ncbi:MAG: TIGR04283 family arsenosugar biosynthesis glycosyltransferase [Acetobacteraceae bacterium]|nr:TIGR04283 family arsenosugar biosynthesis glycosyltransferase [Acetobacteraceae bacterium]